VGQPCARPDDARAHGGGSGSALGAQNEHDQGGRGDPVEDEPGSAERAGTPGWAWDDRRGQVPGYHRHTPARAAGMGRRANARAAPVRGSRAT
jgi:hypothetical protein